MGSLQDLKDHMSICLYGMTTREAIDKGICLECKEPAIPKCYSDAGRREYHISGLCEPCFDKITREEDNGA
jgi:hypothetical protein